ncbi:hypothetical protein STAS_04250 [Striga asiatica]|uniref:Uncharacterized protein n=1 Tax=Striga asiatica TaxID=4170 RepID=A0A5A7P7A7_STRAF|nr:hypothetical protein STAS_04250 [Striga asiatica]
MPSGSKKRKAAKKKKENQTDNNNNPNPSPVSTEAHGDGVDVKPQDDKDSDAGEVSSPASQDHHSRQNNYSSGEDEERENISNPPLVGKEDINDDVIDEPLKKTEAEEGFVPVERESTIEKESDKNDKNFEHDEIASKSYDGAPSRSSSSLSSSDDESNGIKNSKSENAENAPSDIVSEDTSLSGEKVKIDASSEDNNSKAPSIDEPEINDGELEKRSLVEDKVGILEKEVIIIPSVENVGAMSDTRECVAQESDDRLSLSHCWPMLHIQKDLHKEHRGKVVVGCLKCLLDLLDNLKWKWTS